MVAISDANPSFCCFFHIFPHNLGEDGFPSLWLVPEPTQHDGWVFQHRSSGVILSYCTALLGSVAYKSFHIPRRNENISPPQFLKLEKVEIGGIRGKALTSNINKVYEEFRVSKYKYRYKYRYGSVSKEFRVSSPYPQLWQRQLTDVSCVRSECKCMIFICGICLFVVFNPQRCDYDFAIWL